MTETEISDIILTLSVKWIKKEGCLKNLMMNEKYRDEI